MHKIYKITSFSIIAPYTLQISFDDDTQQTINFLPVLYGEMFGSLKDISSFNQVYHDKEVQTIAWPNGADFDPAMLHDWPEYKNEIIERAQTWAYAEKD